MTSEEEKYGYQEDPLPGQVDPATIVDGCDIIIRVYKPEPPCHFLVEDIYIRKVNVRDGCAYGTIDHRKVFYHGHYDKHHTFHDGRSTAAYVYRADNRPANPYVVLLDVITWRMPKPTRDSVALRPPEVDDGSF